ncbi:hypothetical protein B1B04_21465 [Lysinibacillus sp. KCTC 33748]|nr:hypothetical protein B1B04_21465 [Lysinibacillus sp. KCTC 33748]
MLGYRDWLKNSSIHIWNWIFIQFLYLISLLIIAEEDDYLDYRKEEEKIELHNVERMFKE